MAPSSDSEIVVAMSGGVDSSASALLLAQQGYRVVGVAMQVWDYRKHDTCKTTCCAPADFDDAREVAELGGFPFYVLDFEESFEKQVITPFVDAYLKGVTPNPCLDCNKYIKFEALRKRAASMGCNTVATGHYAQIRELECGKLGLFTSVDDRKDQSYFLYSMTQHDLKNTLFPVGAMNKASVRSFLESRGVRTAKKSESQDICFVSGEVGDFIEKRTNKFPKEGDILSADKKLLGSHEGIHRFTVGQRRGLGVSSSEPLYVLQIDSEQNNVIVGAKSELEKREFYANDVNWISGQAPHSELTVLAKLRYRHSGVSCRVEVIEESLSEEGKSRVKVSFMNEWSAVTPGQAVVFYMQDDERNGERQVLGGGIIERQ